MRKTKYRVSYSSKLVKGNLRLSKRIIKTIQRLSIDPFYPGLKTHMVNIPKIGKVYASRVTGDLRIVWMFKGENILLLYRIGGHSDGLNVYN